MEDVDGAGLSERASCVMVVSALFLLFSLLSLGGGCLGGGGEVE